mgnify:CR=1 FL=1
MKNFIKFTQNYIFVFLYLGLFFINSIEIIDRAAQYWFSISLLNLCLFIYLYLSGNIKASFVKPLFRDKIILSFLLFLSAALVSVFFSYNISESFVVLSRWVTSFLSIVLLSIYLYNSSFKIFSLIISFFFLFELYFTFKGYLSIISQTVYTFDFAIYLAGIGANKNITAALFCMQLPFLFFLALNFKNYVFKFFFSLLLALSFYNVFILGSRTAILIVLAQTFLFLGISLFNLKKIKSLSFSLVGYFSTWVFPLLLSLFIYTSSVSSSNNSSLVYRVSSIEIDNASVSERIKFYNYTLDYIMSNPFTPLGIGNWKISSVKWDAPVLKGYTVPYQAHNDFLELASEVTIFGALFYFGVFFFTAFQLFKLINRTKSSNDFFFYVALLLSGSAFFIDSFFNSEANSF